MADDRIPQSIRPAKIEHDEPDEFFDRIEPLRDVVFDVLEAGRAYHAPDVPALGSKGLEELEIEGRYAGAWNTHPAQHAHVLGNIMATAAEDSIMSAALLTDREPVPVLAHATLGRAALNACARAKWLLHPAIELQERVQRVLGLQMSDIELRSRLPTTPEERAHLEEQHNELIAAADVLHLTPVEPPGYTKALEGLFAEPDDRFGRFGTTIACWWGGVGHSELYAIRWYLGTDEAQSTAAGTFTVPFRVGTDDIERVLVILFLGYQQVLKAQRLLFGWDSPELQAVMEQAVPVVDAVLDRLIDNPRAA